MQKLVNNVRRLNRTYYMYNASDMILLRKFLGIARIGPFFFILIGLQIFASVYSVCLADGVTVGPARAHLFFYTYNVGLNI